MFWKDQSGASMVIFGLALPAIVAGVGGAIEISRATAYKQRLSSATELACRHAALSVHEARKEDKKNDRRNVDHSGLVADAITKNFVAKGFLASNGANTGLTASSVQISGSGNQSLVLGTLLNTSNMSFSVVRTCAIEPVPETVLPPPQVLFTESFERESGHSVGANSWSVLQNWNNWRTLGGGVEINSQRALSGNEIRYGDFFAELDSHCYVTGCSSNSTMSRELELQPGSYQVSYWYISRNRIPQYANQLICSTDEDLTGAARNARVSWATLEGQTNRIEVYIEKEGEYTFERQNMVDVCVSSHTWVERKINFVVSETKKYRISWRAAGREDTYGGLIDYLRICKVRCQ